LAAGACSHNKERAGAAVLALVVGFGYKWLKGYVAKTETKIDDQILAAVKKGLEDAGK
jgi:hypothetical protein